MTLFSFSFAKKRETERSTFGIEKIGGLPRIYVSFWKKGALSPPPPLRSPISRPDAEYRGSFEPLTMHGSVRSFSRTAPFPLYARFLWILRPGFPRRRTSSLNWFQCGFFLSRLEWWGRCQVDWHVASYPALSWSRLAISLWRIYEIRSWHPPNLSFQIKEWRAV